MDATIIAIMAEVPKRIYFDSNILRGWPNCSNEIWSILSVANWLKAELYVPKVVEDELEAQFIRGVHEALNQLDTSINQYRKLCRNIIQTDINGTSPTDENLETAFRSRSEEIKKHYAITTVPLTKLPLEVILDMAIHRYAPFEQIQIDKNKHAVTGLQDALILYSIIEHLPKTDDRFILLSADNIFGHQDVKDLLKKTGVTLERVKSASILWKDLFDHVWKDIREPWVREQEDIEADLNVQAETLTGKIAELIRTSGIDQDLWLRARVRKELNITEFRFIKTDLPDSDHLPPRAVYSRPEGSKVPISARATAEMKALVERSEWGSIFGPQTEGQSPIPGLDHATLTEYLMVSIEGTVSEGKIGNFSVTSVEASKT